MVLVEYKQLKTFVDWFQDKTRRGNNGEPNITIYELKRVTGAYLQIVNKL